jgi:ABC-type bacteriocin/lantibiotic exporter with double-glycine peptidase domain
MLINNFKIVKQKRGNTCGYAAADMIMSYLEKQNIDEDYLLEHEPLDAMGITFLKLLEIYRKYLRKYKAEIVYGGVEKMTEVIKDSLCAKIPLQIQYLTANLMGDGQPVLHYSALVGYNEVEDTYSIADPYGSLKTMKKDEFFEAISFRNACLPEIIKQKYPSNMMIRFVENT